MTTNAPSKIGGRAAWTAKELLDNPHWGLKLSEEELSEIEEALNFSKSCEPPIEWEEKGENDAGRVPVNVCRENFPLVKVAERMAAIGEELEHGAGAVMSVRRLQHAAILPIAGTSRCLAWLE